MGSLEKSTSGAVCLHLAALLTVPSLELLSPWVWTHSIPLSLLPSLISPQSSLLRVLTPEALVEQFYLFLWPFSYSLNNDDFQIYIFKPILSFEMHKPNWLLPAGCQSQLKSKLSSLFLNLFPPFISYLPIFK